ncbi:protein translocase subunit SecF [Fusibacter sp. JL298sf-3]
MKMYKITDKYKIWFTISALVILLGLFFMVTKGFNLGIDFTGGTTIQIDFDHKVEVNALQDVLQPFELNAQIIHSGEAQKSVIIKTAASVNSETRNEIVDAIEAQFSGENPVFGETYQFSPNVGDEIRNRALFSITIAAVAMLIYIIIRFEAIFGIAAILALVHDILILLSLYAIFQITVDQSFIAAILTIVGYSINDTIVVFDRVRENVVRQKGLSHFDVANLSITQSLTRTLNTSLTTALVIGSLYFLGVNSIKMFALPLLLGVMVGTYSSIFIANPFWALLRNKIKLKGSYGNK